MSKANPRQRFDFNVSDRSSLRLCEMADLLLRESYVFQCLFRQTRQAMLDFLFRKLKGGWIPVIKFLRPGADRSLPPFLISSKIPSTVRRVLADSSAGLFWELGLLRLVIIIGTIPFR